MGGVFQILARLQEALPDVYRHSLRTAKLVLGTSRYMCWDSAAVEAAVTAALLHDVGKLRIDPLILCKPGRLTAAEWREMRQHPRYGLEMLAGLRLPPGALPGVLYHHERWDGQGYSGLKGDNIPPVARLLAVCDSWEAMTSPRVYQPRKTGPEARQELEQMRGSQFDPALVPFFLDMLQEEQSQNLIARLDQAREGLDWAFQMYRDLHNPVVYVASLLVDDLVLTDVTIQCAATHPKAVES
ncbi:MAG TPA: HD domain-containing protein [Firmicutes bacterium]|nr:HD domain-containing protein [Bacillota bacterium]